MGGPIADERRAANKKRLLHISLGFIVGLLVGGIGVGWLSQWANGTDWRDVGGSLIRGPRCPRCPKGGEVRYVEKQCPVCPKTPEPEVRTVENSETDCPPVIECRCDAPIAVATGAASSPAIGCPVCDPCPKGGAEQGGVEIVESRPGKEAKVKMEARLKALETTATDDAPPASAVNRSESTGGSNNNDDDDDDEPPPEIFDWSPFVYRAMFPYNKISKADVDTAELVAGISVNSFRAQIIGGRLFVKDIRALEFAARLRAQLEDHPARDDATPPRLAGRRRRVQRGRLPHRVAAQRRSARAEALRSRGHVQRAEAPAAVFADDERRHHEGRSVSRFFVLAPRREGRGPAVHDAVVRGARAVDGGGCEDSVRG